MPPTSKGKQELAQHSLTFADASQTVNYNSQLYIPVDYSTGDYFNIPAVETRIWKIVDTAMLYDIVTNQYDTLLMSESETNQFGFRALMLSKRQTEGPKGVFISTGDGLRVLQEDGQLHVPDGSFVPNIIPVPLNEDPDDKQFVMDKLAEWVAGEEQAHSLLRHLATALAPGWSAVKYVLLLGAGRNGKSVFLTMLEQLFGPDNRSGVRRQQIVETPHVMADTIGKLINIVQDGQSKFVKDSGDEKALIAGQEVNVRMLWGQSNTRVHTNALFIEALNSEPESLDKSSALQSRLVRFRFPNKYADDPVFMDRMLSDRMTGALLALLIDHYVRKDEVAVMLTPTTEMIHEQVMHMVDNAATMAWLHELEVEQSPGWKDGRTNDPPMLGGEGLINLTQEEIIDRFKLWLNSQQDYDMIQRMTPRRIREELDMIFMWETKPVRVKGNGLKRMPVATGFTREAVLVIDEAGQMIRVRPEEEVHDEGSVVGDGDV